LSEGGACQAGFPTPDRIADRAAAAEHVIELALARTDDDAAGRVAAEGYDLTSLRAVATCDRQQRK
jgi:hypothetical protein